jgi:hypothetical protein
MNLYVDPDGGFPRHRGDITRIDPSWTEGDPLPDGWLQVVEVAEPTPIYIFEDGLATVTDDDGNESQVERDVSNSWPLTITVHHQGVEISDGVATQTWTPHTFDTEPLSTEPE